MTLHSTSLEPGCDYDCFWAHDYKGGSIQGRHNRTLKREEITVLFADGKRKAVKSYRAAQLALNAARATA